MTNWWNKFQPSKHGFKFKNTAVPVTLIPDIGPLPTELTQGMSVCGGMAQAAKELFLHELVVTERTRGLTDEHDPVFRYLMNRQIETLGGNGSVSDFINGPGYFSWALYFHAQNGSDDSALLDLSGQEIRNLTDRLDNGELPLVGLLYDGAAQLWDNHQVLAYDYSSSGSGRTSRYTFFVYDPNHPEDDNDRIVVEGSSASALSSITQRHSGGNRGVRGFFVMEPERKSAPIPFLSSIPLIPSNVSMSRIQTKEPPSLVVSPRSLQSPEAALPIQPGARKIQQKSSGHLLDAYDKSRDDFAVVTRTAQDDDSQRWSFTPVGVVYTVRQASSDRFLDAHESDEHDFEVVTRIDQDNDTQRWVARPVLGPLSAYTLQQLSTGRFLDAYERESNDFQGVTRDAQNNATQRWLLSPRPDGTFTLVQSSSERFLDAYQSGSQDFSAVTRSDQDNDTQRWIFTPVAGVYTIQQLSTGRFLDAYEGEEQDYGLVTRHAQHNDTQRWVVTSDGDGAYTLQQLSTSRFVDAYQSEPRDYRSVTRSRQHNDTQQWVIG